MQSHHIPPSHQKQQRRPQPADNTANLTENQVEAAIVQFLRGLGWIVERNHVGVYYTSDGRAIHIGRRGQCDWRAVRPDHDEVAGAACEYLEVEVKRPGAKPTKDQQEYMALRSHQGVLVTWADSIGMFRAWYRGMFPGEVGA